MQGHIRSILPQKGGVAPVDNNTVALFRYERDAKDSIRGIESIGYRKALGVKESRVELSSESVLDLPLYGEFTIQAWVYLRTYSDFCIFGKESTSFDFRIESNGTRFNLVKYGVIDQYVTVTDIVPTQKWTHVAAIQFADRVEYYVNGIIVGTYMHKGAYKTAEGVAYIGSNRNQSYVLDGFLSDVKVWSKALSAEENILSMNSSAHQVENLVGWWRLDEGEGNLVQDSSPYGNDGIILNATWGAGQNQYHLMGEGVLLEEETTNIIPLESLTFESGWSDYGGATIKRIQGVFNAEWDTNEATRIQVSGGTNVIVSHIDLMSHTNIESGRQFAVQVKIKNLGANAVYVYSNRQSTYINSGIVRAGESRTVKWVTDSNPAGSGGNLQIQLRNLAADVGKELDFLAFEPQIEEKTYHTFFAKESRSASSLSYSNILGSSNGYTFSFWTKVHADSDGGGNGEQPLLSLRDPNKGLDSPMFISRTPSTKKIRFWGKAIGGNYNWLIASTSTIELDSWVHVAVVLDGDEARLYLNGILEGVKSGVDITSIPDCNKLYIGSEDPEWSQQRVLNGVIDELRIDKIARTAEEIQAWYHHGRGMMA